MMPFTMTIGALFYPFFGKFDFLTPYLIFLMLFFTYCGMSVKAIRFSPMHFWLILIQIVGSVGLYLLLKNVDATLAQSGLICLLAPTATSAVVITGMLKGNTASLTAYTLLGNLMAAVMAPFLFSLWGANSQVSFWDSFFHIAQRVFILLLGPLTLAVALKRIWPRGADEVQKKSIVSFYLWVIALAIVTATTVKFVSTQDPGRYDLKIGIALVALVACVSQFWVGRRIGRLYDDKIAGGQGLGQKNTILAIWLAHTYLNPLASVAPGAYILWQNIINSWQLWRIRREL